MLECVIYNQLPPIDEGTLQTAARHRHIDLISFLMSKKAPVDEEALYDAIIRGFDDICILLYNYSLLVLEFPILNQYHIILAKMWNRHNVLEYFKDKAIIQSSSIPHRDYVITSFDYYNADLPQRLYYACSHGEVDVLKCYFANGRGSIEMKIKEVVFIWSASNYKHEHTDMLYTTVLHGQFEALKFLEQRYKEKYGEEYKSNTKYTACAARIGRMDMFTYLIENCYAVCEKAMEHTIEKCRLILPTSS